MRQLVAAILALLLTAQPAFAQFLGPGNKPKASEFGHLNIRSNSPQPFSLTETGGRPPFAELIQSHMPVFLDFRNAGNATAFSAEEWGLGIFSSAEATPASTAAYEKAGIFSRITNYDTSTFQNDRTAVGIIGQGYTDSNNSFGESWGVIGGAGINPGGVGDGTLIGLESDVFNNGTAQSALFTNTSKYGLIIDNFGPQAMTVAIDIQPTPSLLYTGIYTDPGSFVDPTDDVLNVNGVTTLQANGNFATIGAASIGTLSAPTYGLLVDVNNASALPLEVQNSWGSVNASHITADFDAYGDIPRFALRRADGSQASPTAVQSGDVTGNLNFRGYTSAGAFTAGAVSIAAEATENYSSTNNGTELLLTTTPTGGNSTFTAETLLSGVQFGGPTGGDKGTGTVNASGSYFENGLPIISGVCQGSSASVSASTTDYGACGENASVSVISTEANTQTNLPAACTISNLYIHFATTSSSSHEPVFTVDKNTSGSALTCTPSGATTSCNDATHTFSVAAGSDLLSLKIANPASANATGIVNFSYQYNCD